MRATGLAALAQAPSPGPSRRAPDHVSAFNEGRFVLDTILLDVPTASVPRLTTGDTIEIGASIYEVRADPVRDADRLIWTAEAREL